MLSLEDTACIGIQLRPFCIGIAPVTMRRGRVPSSHTCALDLFPAGEAHYLIASDRSWFRAEAWTARTKRLGSRYVGRQIVGKCRLGRNAVARPVVCRRPRRSISIRCRAALI